ncbi:MAG: HAD-IA family hydrolase [Chloroflexi bacterium]|nr:HAD-IA family hydrolase [Chloroflexota bacterium]
MNEWANERLDVEAVLFDFDGTLVHLNIDFAQMRADVEAVLPKYALSAEGKESLYTLELVEECVQVLIKRDGEKTAAAFRREAEAAILAIEMGAASSAEIHPGVPELLEKLRERGIKIGIVTRNCRAAVEHILGKNTLVYDALLTRDDVEAVKPDPEHLLAALRLLGIEPRHALMVGDHPMDVRAGRAVGAKTVAVLTGYSPVARFAPEEPDLILERVGELVAYLAWPKALCE